MVTAAGLVRRRTDFEQFWERGKKKMTVISTEEKDELVAYLQDVFPLMPIENLRRQLIAASWNPDDAIDKCLNADSNDIANVVDEDVNLQQITSSVSPYGHENEYERPDEIEEGYTKLAIRLRVCREGVPYRVVIQALTQLLAECDAELEGEVHLTPSMQAAYEDAVVEVRGVVVVHMGDGREAVARLAINFCERTAFGLHLQPLLDILTIDRIFSHIHPQHINVDIVYLAVGNMPSWGLFFVHGDFTPTPNRLGGAAGNHQLTSWGEFEHDRRVMTLFFAVQDVSAAAGVRGYKMVVRYDQFHSIIVDCGRGDDDASDSRFVFIRLRCPPQLWEAIPRKSDRGGGRQGGGGREFLNITRCSEWLRTLHWPSGDRPGTRGCSTETLASSSFLCFGLAKNKIELLRQNARAEPARGSDTPTVQLFEIIGRWRRKMKCAITFGAVKMVAHPSPQPMPPPDLGTFRANYALEALISRGNVVRAQLTLASSQETPMLYRRLQWCMKESALATEEALEHLLAAVDEKRNISLLNAFEYLYSQRLADNRRALAGEVVDSFGPDVPDNCILVRKVMVMPMRVLMLPPEVMMTNRVVRHFGHEYAMRCVFRDDNGQKLVPSEFYRGRSQEGRSAIIEEMVQRVLQNGLLLAGRLYEFLAWSNSQMRDHGCFMFATSSYTDRRTGEVRDATIADIRRWMGDFTASKNVPKMMSRMGQCFTQAIPTIELKRTDWRLVPDVEGGALNPETDEVYCFSDGIGRVSMKAAERIAQKLEVTPVPSCFQVRFKGFKGVLTVDPQMDAEGGAECIEFRESQKKFDDPEDTSQLLEVVKYSMPSPLFLNRPLVMILDQVSRKQGRVTHERVSNGIHALLEMELNAMAEMLCCEEKSAEALFSRLPVRIDFHQLRDNGFLLTKEPFFRSLLLAIHRYNIKQQLNKAKVAIPPNLGRTMYGVMDETGMLQYGQVFVQYSPNVRAASEEVITHLGRTLVTKNPCLVPGDVRLFEAVYHPALAHLRDVIVFPRHGPRPHPDEMAGSDLDGDEYSVLFDPRLMFDRNEDAMHFPKATLRDAHCPPTTADMIAFFLTYMNMDMIGRISNAHLMAADRLGIFHPICEQIARKNAIAVDFPKTGQPAERLERDERTYRAPDFMQKSGVQPAYCSKRLVGQIFRKAKKVEDILDLGQFSVQDDSWDADLYNEAYFAQNESVKIRACAVRDQYNAKLQQLLDEYGVGDEASLVSGHMVSIKNRISEQEKEDFSFYNTDKVVELRYGRIFDSFRKEFFKEFGGEAEFVHVDASGRKSVRVNEALLNKAHAWYMVTYGPHSTGNVARFRSFPWIVWDILLQIKRRNVYGSHRATSGMRTDPLPQELAAAVDAHCVESSALMAEYRAQLMEDPATALVSLRRYCARYRCLDQLLFTVHHWAKTDGLFEQSPFRPEHLAILFLQFGLGLCETDVGNGAPASRSHYLIEQVDEMPDVAATPIDLSLSKGNFLLDFIKYLASQKFFTARCIQLREPNLCNPNSVGMLLNRPHQWRPLAAVAFKTYHHIALTGRFTALHISSPEELPTPIDAIPWDYGETFEPITVELPNAAGAMIDNQLALGDSEIAEILKAWSKVDQIQMRRMNSSKGEQVFVSAAGKLAARQRLHRILLMDQAQLLEHLRNGNVPIAARDETL